MKDELSFSEIEKRVREKYGLSENESSEYVRTAFETVSFLAKNTELTCKDKVKVIISGLILTAVFASSYAFAVIKSGYNFLLVYVVFAYLLSALLYLVAQKKGGFFLEVISGLFMVLCYLLGEYSVFVHALVKEFQQRNIPAGGGFEVFYRSSGLFFTEYLLSRSVYEYVILGCSVLIASSFFFRIRIKRVRK